jgi:AAA family ATP:ADP antiporter
LDHDAKTKGKSAIDVLGARLGKSGGALSQQLLVMLFGSIMTGAPIVAVLFSLGIAAWIGAVNSLAPMFKERSEIIGISTVNKKAK